jgi:hypothetical protein
VRLQVSMVKRALRQVSGGTPLKTALSKERRANKRLRAIISNLESAVAQNQRDLDLQFARIAQLQAEVDLLKRHARAS